MPVRVERLLLLVSLVSVFSSPAFCQWTSIDLPCRPEILSLQRWQGNLYANSAGSKVFKSTDGGASWALAFSGSSFAINPYNGRFYRILNDQTSIEFSTDQGNTWATLGANWFSSNYRPSFAFSRDTVYLNIQGKFLRFAQNWVPVAELGSAYSSQFFVFGKHIWAPSYSDLLHSSNGGISWDTVMTASSLQLAASGDTLLLHTFDYFTYTGTTSRTVNQGITWETDSGHPDFISIGGSKPFFAYDTKTGMSWYAWNGLTDWQPLNISVPPTALVEANGVKIAGLQSGVVYEKAGSWLPVSFGTGIPGEMNYANVQLQKTDTHLLFGGEAGGFGLAKRSDSGNSWSLSDKPYFADQPVRTGNQLIGAGKYGTYRAPLGVPDFEWQLVNSRGGFLFGMNGKLYLIDPNDYRIYRSLDAGQTWIQTGGVLPAFEKVASGLVSLLAASDGRIYLRDGKKLVVSEDEGLSWSLRYVFPQITVTGEIGRLFATNGRVFLSHVPSQEIFVSTDFGFNFSTLPAPKNTNTMYGPYRLRILENTLFLYNGDKKLYRSSDWGQTWKSLKPPYPGFDFDVAIATNTTTMYNSVVYLFDPSKGVAWTANINSVPYTPCDDITIDMASEFCSDYLYLSVSGTIPGLQYSWYKDGVVIQQSNDYAPQFLGQTGSTYVLSIRDPGTGCVISDTTRIVPFPVAEAQFTPILPCHLELATLDLSGSSHYPGIRQGLYQVFPPYAQVYYNEFDGAGIPTNPNPPALPPGLYHLLVEDKISGCVGIDTILIQRDPAETISDYSTGYATCGQADGTAQIINNGSPAAVYGWSTGATTKSISGLGPGWYSVTVTNGFCRDQYNFEIKESPTCKVYIQGRVWNDSASPDCLYDFSTLPAAGVMLHLLPDDIYTYTDNQGFYEFSRSPGSYTIAFADPLRFNLLCPAAGTVSVNLPNFGAVSTGNDFFVQPKPVKNLAVSVMSGPAVPGFMQQFYYHVCNYGDTDVPDVSVIFDHDPALTNLNPPGAFDAYDPDTHRARSDNIYLFPNYCNTYSFQLYVPADVPLGTVLHFSADILPDAGDFTPADNHQQWAQTVVGSFDPNDKRVSPGETEFGGKIFDQDTVLRYTIRFQNTGKYPATTVEIRDTLDNNLDVTSILPGGSSHPYNLQLRFEGHNILVFRFDNIHLPDSMANQALSQGYVSFSIKRKPGLAYGTRIRNRAGIYFDFNKPVLTNTVESVLSGPLAVRPAEPVLPPLVVYPNPGAGACTALLPWPAPEDLLLRLFDLAGRPVFEQRAQTGYREQALPPAAELPPGVYVLQAVADGRLLGVARIVRE